MIYKPVLDVLSYKETSETVRKEHFNSPKIFCLVDIFQNAERGSSIYHFVSIAKY